MKKYFAFDTETINRTGYGEACLLLSETESGGVSYLESPENFEQIFNFLSARKSYIAFNAAFDIRAILHPRYVPLQVIESLANYDCASWAGFNFFHIPQKYLRVWRRGCGEFEIYDLKSFFQGHSLDGAAKKFLSVERKHEIPPAWYSCMDKCLADFRRSQLLEYAAQDVRVLSALYKVLISSFEAAGISDPPLYSPGSASMCVFGPELLRQKPNDAVNKIFKRGYFGGRIEVERLGKITGPLNYYDLKSAYPAEFSELPDLATAGFRSGKSGWKYSADTLAGCYKIEAYIPHDLNFGPLAVKIGEEKVVFPVGHVKTFCGFSAVQTLKKYGIEFDVTEYAEFFGGTGSKPFKSLVNELFKLRKDPQKSLAIKLILNSAYGKTAESKDYRQAIPDRLYSVFARYFLRSSEYGKYTNFPYSAMITERVRLKLWESAIAAGACLLSTDGIICQGDLKTGGSLGDWELKGIIKSGVILGCGRYALEYADGRKEYHFRGFSKPERIFKNLRVCNKKSYPEYILDTKSLKQWNLAIDKADFNVLKEIKKDIIVMDNKRHWPAEFPLISDYFKKGIKSAPLYGENL